MAEALAEARGLSAESAGVAAQHGDGAAPYAVRALQQARGLALSHTPQPIARLDLDRFDQIVALDASVAQRLRTDYDLSPEELVIWVIPDPYGGPLADYRYSLEQIEAALDQLLAE